MATLQSERRRSTRNRDDRSGWLIADEVPARLAIRTRDLSSHGLGFHSLRPFRVGNTYTMELGRGDKRLIAQIKVVATRPANNGLFAIGAEFC